MAYEAVRQAIFDGVMIGVRQQTVRIFDAYHHLRSDMTQQHRAQDALLELVLAAEEMLKMAVDLTADD